MQRIAYESGFPAGEPEIVFKFRHEDMQKAAELDVRPNFAGNYRIKFKAEALPLKDQVGGYRLLFSHNAQFPLGQAPEGDRQSMGTLARVFPALGALKASDTDRVDLVNQTIVEEVLQDLGVLDFGKGITAESNIGIWRERGTRHPLCGEFAFQAKFKRRDEVHEKVIHRCQQFFIALRSPVMTGSFSARPRPGSSIGSRAIRPRVTSKNKPPRTGIVQTAASNFGPYDFRSWP
jgi:hypothetical protein